MEISSLNVKAGDQVSKGQIMAIVDDRIIRQSFKMQAQLDLAYSNGYNKQKESLGTENWQ